MKRKMRLFFCISLSLLMLTLCFAGCAKQEEGGVATQIPKWSRQREALEHLQMVVTEADFELLEECVNLKTLDLTGSTCYDAIMAYMQKHPQVDVTYTVSIGEHTFPNSQSSLTLEEGSFDMASLMENLHYLPRVASVHLPKTSLMNEDLNYIRQVYPDLELSYTVQMLGEELSPDVAELDLTTMEDGDLEAVLDRIPLLTELKTIKLTDEAGNGGPSTKVARYLMDALPGYEIEYYISLFGQLLSNKTERVEFKDQKIGNEGEAQIRAALDVLKNCTYLKLENCGIDNEVLASIRADYPQTKVVWRITFGPYSYLTDTEVIRAVYNVEDKHVPLLRYFKDVKYIDMGHNTTLTDLSFVSEMPNLEIMIGSGSSVKNLNGFENCKKLEFLELGYCYALTDASPLAQCPNLQYLNLSFTAVSDLTCLYELPLKRFICLDPRADWEAREEFTARHPDCWIRFTGENPYSLGWRYDDIGETRSEIYIKVREVFNLDEVDRRLARQQAAEEAAKAATAPAPEPET